MSTDPTPAARPGPSSILRGLKDRPVLVALLLLAALVAVRLALQPSLLDLAILALAAGIGVAVVRDRIRAEEVEGARRGQAESFARILRGLSRSVSPDAIVDAIVEEVGEGTGADYVAVVRRRPDTRVIDAVLSPTRSGAAASRTTLPLQELEDPAPEQPAPEGSSALARRRRQAPVPASLDAARAPASMRPAQGMPPTGGADQRIAERIAARLRDTYGLSNTRAAPLRVNGRVEGAIVLARRAGAPWPDTAGGFLQAAAVEASAALARVYSQRDAEARAALDALTGLPNRGYFDEYVGLITRRRRVEDRIGVLMIDIDRFKGLNDRYGHAVGDEVLREVAGAIAGAVREGDVPARFGGEEFAVLLRNPSPQVAVDVGERVRRAVGSLDLHRVGVPGVSVSVGVAVADEPDMPLEVVVEAADRALYRAKRAGRDRVVAA